MRKLALVIAVLALAACGEGRNVDAPRPQPATEATSAPATAPQWHLEVRGEITQAVSDLSGWLIEHGYVSSVIRDEGKTRILMGPYATKPDAEAKQAEVVAALTRAKKQNIEVLVIEHPVIQ